MGKDDKKRKKIAELLGELIASCEEGISGDWEPNEEGFEAMIESLEEIKKLIGGAE